VTFDFRDAPPPREGPCGNLYRVNLVSCCRVGLKCIVAPHISANHGMYRPMKVLTTPGTITHAIHPAPGTTWGDVGRAVIEGVFSALAPAVPDRVIANQSGYGHTMAIAGIRPDSGEPYVHLSPYAVGFGARATKDGINALCSIINGDNDNVPCEVVEAEFPLRIDRYELMQDAGGPGKFRGGLAPRTDIRILSDGATVSGSFDRYDFPPQGLFGGKPGMTSALILDLGGESEANRPKVGGWPVPRNSIVSHQPGGGGGYGDPHERSRDLVIADVENGYVSRESAVRDYGLTPDLLPDDG
jgi:N-methylhydantoinase B